jgi:hypothetical protein
MWIDIRWIALVAACTFVIVLVRTRREWVEPLLVVAAIAAVLITLLFFVTTPATVHR